MIDDVPSALTADEWAACEEIVRAGGDPLQYAVLDSADRAMCWINGNRPDHDPHRITMDDVRTVLACAEWDEQREKAGKPHDWTPEGRAMIRALASKLEAFLPPARP